MNYAKLNSDLDLNRLKWSYKGGNPHTWISLQASTHNIKFRLEFDFDASHAVCMVLFMDSMMQSDSVTHLLFSKDTTRERYRFTKQDIRRLRTNNISTIKSILKRTCCTDPYSTVLYKSIDPETLQALALYAMPERMMQLLLTSRW